MSIPRRTLAVAYGPRSVPVMALAEAAADRCDLVWVIDSTGPGVAEMLPLLHRFGPVVDTAGSDPVTSAAALAEWKPDGLVTFFDAGMVELATMAEHVGLEFHRPATAALLVDKAAQRRALADAGIESPPCWVVPAGPVEEAVDCLPDDAPWPLVVKPRSESGSRHTFRCRDRDEVRTLFRSLGQDREEMVAEGYLPDDPERVGPWADYVSVETVVADDAVTALAVTGRFPPAPHFRETGFYIPAVLPPHELEAVIELSRRSVRALGVTCGCLHVEVKLTADGPRLIEVNGRLGGGIPEMLQLAAGFDALGLAFDLALGQAVEVDDLLPCARVGFRFFLQPPAIVGTVRSIDGLDALNGHPYVDRFQVHRGPGSAVDWREGTRTFILQALGSAADHDGVLEVDRLLRDRIHVAYDAAGPEGS